MATVTKPIALNESFNTTDATPVNIADVLKDGLESVASAISPNASDIPYDNTTSGLTADDVQEAIDELATEKADSATTLNGYGITNAYTKTETDNLLSAKQNTLTFDDTPTEDSANPVKSGGVYDALADKMSYADNSVLGAKNLLPMVLSNIKAINTGGTWSDNVYSYNGTDFTFNTDSEGNIINITLDGTASSRADVYLAGNATRNWNGCIMTGCPSGGGSSTYKIQCYDQTYSTANDDIGSGTTISAANGDTIRVLMIVYAGNVATNLTFYPMIRLATDTDDTFQPYAMTNKELTSEVNAISTDLATLFPGSLTSRETLATYTLSDTDKHSYTIVATYTGWIGLEHNSNNASLDLYTRIRFSNKLGYSNRYTRASYNTEPTFYLPVKAGQSVYVEYVKFSGSDAATLTVFLYH